jgi:hypothetical protein
MLFYASNRPCKPKYGIIYDEDEKRLLSGVE